MRQQPYSVTKIYTEETLPKPLLSRHDTKAGVWALIRVIEGRLKLVLLDPDSGQPVSEQIVDAENPGRILPQQPHFVAPLGPLKVQLEFYDVPPAP